MAIIGRISSEPVVTPAFQVAITIDYFDDADPNNEGYANGHSPRSVLRRDTLTYAPTLQGSALQNQVKTDVKATIASLQAAVDAASADKPLLPVGFLIAANS